VEQARRPGERTLLLKVKEDLENGFSFSEALSRHPDLFPPFYVGLVRAGEQSGDLGVPLSRLADFLEDDAEVRSQVKAALAYPGFIAGMGVLTLLGMFLFVVPKLMVFFNDVEAVLPWPTRVVLGMSRMIRGGAMASPLLILLCVGVWKSRWRVGVRKGFERFKQSPPWGDLLIKSSLSRYCKTLALLIQSGVPFLEAILVAREAVESPGLRSPMTQAASLVEQGHSLGGALLAVGGFPDMFCHMIRVGEESNTLPECLEKTAAVYRRETERALKTSISMLEPALILGVGSVIGFIVVALLLPVFSMSTYLN
jgi:type II secretory pathway component PulF